MKLFLGHIVHLQGGIDSCDSVAPEARILITLLQRVAMNPRFHASWLKGNFSQVTPLHSHSFPCDFTVNDKWPDSKSSSNYRSGEKTSWMCYGGWGTDYCPRSLWDSSSTFSVFCPEKKSWHHVTNYNLIECSKGRCLRTTCTQWLIQHLSMKTLNPVSTLLRSSRLWQKYT